MTDWVGEVRVPSESQETETCLQVTSPHTGMELLDRDRHTDRDRERERHTHTDRGVGKRETQNDRDSH